MSIALTGRRPYLGPLRWALPWVGMGLCLLILGGHLVFDAVSRRSRPEARSGEMPTPLPPKARVVEDSGHAATTVSMTDAKVQAAKLTTEAVHFVEMPTELGVPGLIDYNADRQIQIRPRATGVLREVHAVLGQSVRRGDPLATLDSPEIGTARLNLRARQRELSTARIEADWKSQVASAVALLIPEIRRKTDPGAIDKEFSDKPLGSYRASLLQAYAEFDIAAHEEEKSSFLRSQEIQGEHPALIARHQREGLQAKLFATIEQARFDAAQEKRLADQRVMRAQADVIDAAQRLRILGVPEDIRKLLEETDKANDQAIDEDITIYRIVSPFDGTVIKKDAVISQRAEPADVLFTVADLKVVWVTASVGENDVAKVPKIRGGGIRFTATTYGSRVFPARLLSVGAMVDPQTRTVSLLAETENHEGLLKPGMFVRILLDSPTSERVLVVPHAAVVEIEGKQGVFVPAGAATAEAPHSRAYTFRPIEPGREANDRVVVRAGLKEGDLIVATGAYQLKSELILQNQDEDD